jgi:hypothetical protein
LGELYEEKFSYYSRHDTKTPFKILQDAFYDFLFEHNYETWFCNIIKRLANRRRVVKEHIMRLHTGETQFSATPTWTWEQRQKLGQKYLFDLAQDILVFYANSDSRISEDEQKLIKKLVSNLELDGYIFQNKKLLIPERDVLEIQEEIGVIQTLFKNLHLPNSELTFHHLKLAEEHYLQEKWDDSISNSRKFLESILREIASHHSKNVKGIDLTKATYERPAQIRDYLENEGLLETKEKEAIAKIYGLLSDTGSHPYMAEKDQARLLRQLSLTCAQFVLIRYQGFLKK